MDSATPDPAANGLAVRTELIHAEMFRVLYGSAAVVVVWPIYSAGAILTIDWLCDPTLAQAADRKGIRG